MDQTVSKAPTEETFEGVGGLRIFFRSWRPEGTPRAVIAICHGVNSHSGQYFWTAEQLVASKGVDRHAPAGGVSPRRHHARIASRAPEKAFSGRASVCI
jgi:hypothetical protein